jgi:DNA-binding transcriptional LysR family regulator
LDWDDLRFAVTLARTGSLAETGQSLGVDPSTVGRRVAAAERALGVRLFARSTAGYVLTPDGERLVAPLERVASAVDDTLRTAAARDAGLEGTVRVTAPESFGVAWLAPRLATLGASHPRLRIELVPSGAVLDLVRREADVAIRTVRTRHTSLVARRFLTVRHALYASATYLRKRPVTSEADLAQHPLLVPTSGVELAWITSIVATPRIALAVELSLALVEAARAGAGVAVLPRYLGDRAPDLVRLAVGRDPPEETLWLTVHGDLRRAPRFRLIMDELIAAARAEPR